MQLEGIHHVTAITADAQRNVDFYAGVLGLRLVKKTVNQDNPTVYHLFYADEKGDPGSDITFFEYPGTAPAAPGTGWSTGSSGEWARPIRSTSGRVASASTASRPQRSTAAGFDSRDPEGLEHELLVPDTDDEPMTAEHPEIPAELALQGFEGVRAYASNPDASRSLLEETLGFDARGAERLLGVAGRHPGLHVRLRRAAREGRCPGRGHRAPRGLGVPGGGARGVARPGARGRHAGRRP